MSKSSGSFISLPTIIFLVVMYNVIFDDDEEKKDVEVKVDDTPVISEELEEDLKGVKKELLEAFDEAKEAFNQAKEEFIEEDEPKQKPKEEVIISEETPKKVEPEKLKPLDEEKEDKPMRSL